MKKKKLPCNTKTLNVTVAIERAEPQVSICMGYPGISGTASPAGKKGKRWKFDSCIDMCGRGMIISYEKPSGVKGSYNLDFPTILQAIIDEDERVSE